MTIRYPTDAGDPHGVNVEEDNTLLTNPVSVRLPQASDPCQADVINAPAKELRDRLALVEEHIVWNDEGLAIPTFRRNTSINTGEMGVFSLDGGDFHLRCSSGEAGSTIDVNDSLSVTSGGDLSLEGDSVSVKGTSSLVIGAIGSSQPSFPNGFNTGGQITNCTIDGTLEVDHISCQQNLVMDETTIFSKNAQVNGTLSTNTISPTSGSVVSIPATARAERLDVRGPADVTGSVSVTGSVNAYGGVKSDSIGTYDGTGIIGVRNTASFDGGLIGWQLHIAINHTQGGNCVTLICGTRALCVDETAENVAAYVKAHGLNLVLVGGACPNPTTSSSTANQNAKTLRLLSSWSVMEIASRIEYAASGSDTPQGVGADYIGMNVIGV